MLTETECLARAVDMDRKSKLCAGVLVRDEFLGLARQWRDLARMAAWQDAWSRSTAI